MQIPPNEFLKAVKGCMQLHIAKQNGWMDDITGRNGWKDDGNVVSYLVFIATGSLTGWVK